MLIQYNGCLLTPGWLNKWKKKQVNKRYKVFIRFCLVVLIQNVSAAISYSLGCRWVMGGGRGRQIDVFFSVNIGINMYLYYIYVYICQYSQKKDISHSTYIHICIHVYVCICIRMYVYIHTHDSSTKSGILYLIF